MIEGYIDYLLNRVPNFDKKLLEEMRPSTRRIVPRWWKSREIVRRLSEGIGFKASEKVEEVIEDGWIGLVSMGEFHPSDLRSHIFDRVHVSTPGL